MEWAGLVEMKAIGGWPGPAKEEGPGSSDLLRSAQGYCLRL